VYNIVVSTITGCLRVVLSEYVITKLIVSLVILSGCKLYNSRCVINGGPYPLYNNLYSTDIKTNKTVRG